MHTSIISEGGWGATALLTRRARSLILALVAALATVAAMLAVPALSRADTSSTLTVIGTSDVSDSQLMQNVIEPAFEAQFPQYSISYVGTGTGQAIANAEAGTSGASVLIVHAASLENQFVSQGYSYPTGTYGNALFTNKFVLAGSPGDPAGIGTDDPGNMTQAFIDIAASGINGNSFFVSRGGTPGTSVEEHAIWALADADLHSALPSGLLLCTINAASGGGEAPIAAGNGVTADGQPCPNSGAVPSSALAPSWYVITGLTQGPNVEAASTCSYGGGNNCYVFTDDGTYANLQNQNEIPNLTIDTSNNTGTGAVGGQFLLVNYFHGYIINPGKPNENINLPAAQDFISLITSPSVQQQIVAYLSGTTFAQTFGAPYTATAAPTITAKLSAKSVKSGGKVTATGKVINDEVGFPVLSGVKVYINEVSPTALSKIAVGTTTSTGKFTVKFTPPATGTYDVTTGTITKIENKKLSPPFGDQFVPGTSNTVSVTVKGS
jgi:tungstate transport system substrate-binding protein